MNFEKLFARMAAATAHATGTPVAFCICVLVVAVWGLTGPLFHFSDTWQLVINTGTTIITFLMVFLIQNTQNRDGAAIQIKLDELILTSTAENEFIGIEVLTDHELARLRSRCADAAHKTQQMVAAADAVLHARKSGTHNPHHRVAHAAAMAVPKPEPGPVGAALAAAEAERVVLVASEPAAKPKAAAKAKAKPKAVAAKKPAAKPAAAKPAAAKPAAAKAPAPKAAAAPKTPAPRKKPA